jgi:hypothetical protein
MAPVADCHHEERVVAPQAVLGGDRVDIFGVCLAACAVHEQGPELDVLLILERLDSVEGLVPLRIGQRAGLVDDALGQLLGQRRCGQGQSEQRHKRERL